MATQPTTGDGLTLETAYLVENGEHIDYMRVEPDAFYEFNDRDTIDLGIDLLDSGSPFYNSGEGWIPIGQDAGGDFAFTGHIEGNGAKIININIDRSGGVSNQALFRELGDGCTINDLQTDGDVTCDFVTVGILFGKAVLGAQINRCKQTGSTESTRGFGGLQVGGFGFIDNADVRDCYSEVNASDGGLGGDRVGSFAGRVSADDVSGTITGKVCVDRCYSNGVVTGANGEGFVGTSGQIGASDDVLNSFWDTDLSTKSTGGTSVGLTGLTTAQFGDISNFTGAGWDIVTEANHDGELATAVWYHDGSVPRLWYEITPTTVTSGTITLSGVAQANAVVDIISCPTVSEGTKTIVEQVTADGNGVYTATVERNTALNYWAEPRHYVEEFTGTLTPVSGTTFSTGVDLTGVSIGGANDPLYVLKSTGGTASGNEVVVESRSGNDITLSYDPGFDGTTTFSLGKAYGTNTVLARSAVS